MKKLSFVLAATAAMTLTACASAPSKPVYQVNAKVQSVKRAPEICTNQRGSAGGMVLGAIVGGLIGNQIGKGSGRVVATAIGTATGAAVGAPSEYADGKYRCERDGYIAVVSYIHPATNQMVTKPIPLQRYTRAEYIRISVE